MTERVRRAQPHTAFSIFATFYMTAFLLDITEMWHYPRPALIALAIALVIAVRGVTRWTFFVFLAVTTWHTLTTEFPDLGNHDNIYLLCSIFMMAGIVYRSLRRREVRSDDEFFEILKPPLRGILALVYLFAGFHKLNWDFFDPAVGCAANFSSRLLKVFLLPELMLPELVVFGTAVFVLAWEIGGGLALWVRRLQAPVLLFCWAMHSMLAQIVFFDFSSLAFALFLAFVPASYWALLGEESAVHVGPIRLQRYQAYLYINAIAALAAGGFFWTYGYSARVHRVQGAALVSASLVFLWPWIKQIFKGRQRIPWDGVAIWGRNMSRWSVALPLFVMFIGMNPYLGLRTAGTFSMFSNLRTEGEHSNHWLLRSNSLKLWGYQEDLVEVVSLRRPNDDRRHPAEGYLLPAVEFKKMIYSWRKSGVVGLQAVFDYGGRVYETGDLVRDNPWNVDGRDLEMLLLDFRVVQKSPTPNHCRW
jgi:hypothetical protein